MLTLKPVPLFRKDSQKLAARGRDFLKLVTPLAILLNRQSLPPQYQDHPLKGEWLGYREFHVEFDWVVIYKIVNDFLVLARTSTHADLF